ncbi:hypothetical protein [Mycetocola sp. 2940]|uniref:hypothetical protein n=1 Tax=Mycetocola sp. 2940 TaxID=3156452 RepID=UPI003397EC41
MPYTQPTDLQRPSWSARLVPGGLALAGAIGAIGAVGLGASTVLVWLVGIVGISTVLARFMPVAVSVASAVIFGLFYSLMLIRLVPFGPDSLSWTWLPAMAAPAIVAAVLLFTTPPRPRRGWNRNTVATVVAVGLPALIAAASAIAIVLRFGLTHLSWSMNRDAVTSMIFSRFLVEDGGASAERANPLLLPYGLIAAVLVPGRSASPPEGLLEHDIVRMAGLWLVIVLATSVLAALVAVTTIPARRWGTRLVFGLVAGILPVSWFLAGSAFAFGFFNATLTVLILLASWLVWRRSNATPAWSVCLLLLASTTLLATWSPFAVVTAALAAAATALNWRRLVSPAALFWVALSAAQLLAWGCLVTVPDFLRDGQHLGSGGGIFDSSPLAFALIALLAVVIGFVSRAREGEALDRIGVIVILAASAPLLVYFLSFRWGTDDVWTYFPAKFSWLVSSVLLILIVALSGRVVADLDRGASVRAVVATTVLGLLGGLMLWAVPLTKQASDAYPALSVWRSVSISEHDPFLRTAFDLSSPEENNLAVRYNGVAGDYFVNAWLLQVNVESMQDPIRQYAYSYFAWDAADTCDVVEEIGRPVTIWTRDSALLTELDTVCPDGDYSVRLQQG